MGRKGDTAIYSRGRVYYVEGVGILFDWGTTVPADGRADYAKGAIFQHIDGEAATCLYVNEGTLASCSFRANTSVAAAALETALALTTTPGGASKVGVFDTTGYWTAQTVEAILAELGELMFRPSGTAAGIGPSPLIWDDCPLFEMMLDPTVGFCYFDDFMGQTVDPGATASNGGWTVTRLTGGTIGSVIGVGGVLEIAAAATQDQGIQAQLLNCCVKPTAAKTIWFEARIQVSHIDNLIFVGLASADSTLIAAGVLDETNPSSIGFFTDENSTSTKYGTITQKAGNNDTTEDIAVGLAQATWAKVGFKVTGVSKVEFFYDGVLVETGETTASIADAVEMVLSLVCQNQDGANVNTLKVDWVRVAQLR